MMKLLAKVEAGKTMIKESYKESFKLHMISQFVPQNENVKMKSILSRLIVVGFRIWKNQI